MKLTEEQKELFEEVGREGAKKSWRPGSKQNRSPERWRRMQQLSVVSRRMKKGESPTLPEDRINASLK